MAPTVEVRSFEWKCTSTTVHFNNSHLYSMEHENIFSPPDVLLSTHIKQSLWLIYTVSITMYTTQKFYRDLQFSNLISQSMIP